ncbi:hypothetical protein [Streptomyces sp. NPDC015131]|uniref:hypothetical protein n=1 Tax=Streptomyces sp. NPDC015131 TaxID=3364941 RepID=UPI0036F542E3
MHRSEEVAEALMAAAETVLRRGGSDEEALEAIRQEAKRLGRLDLITATHRMRRRR